MKTGQSLLLVGNWKMNPSTFSKAKKLFLDVRSGLGRRSRQTEIVVGPPALYLSELQRFSPSGRIQLAAQDVFYEEKGAFTGELSISMLKSVDTRFVIVGHSERRAHGETDEVVGKKLQATLKGGMTAILCVGEKSRDSHGEYFSIVEGQLQAALASVTAPQLKRLVIAYEPIWAIGTGKTDTPADAQEMKLFIQKVLTDRFSRAAAMRIKILYGGSVKKTNAATLLADGDVDGFLVGGASLEPSEFVAIANHMEAYGTTKAT